MYMSLWMCGYWEKTKPAADDMKAYIRPVLIGRNTQSTGGLIRIDKKGGHAGRCMSSFFGAGADGMKSCHAAAGGHF